MSQSKSLPKLISRFEIGFDNETKVEIGALKSKLDEVTRALSVKNASHGDRLLAAMQAEAANDVPEPELKQMGQWVFEGQDEKWISAHVDDDGCGYLCSLPKRLMEAKTSIWGGTQRSIDYSEIETIQGIFEASHWRESNINRETVNDVDYLSESGLEECVPHIDDVLDQPNWLSESAPQITQADMQLIFIKNLSEILIQRMHSMDRFTNDDSAIDDDNLMTWDIITDGNNSGFAVVMAGFVIDGQGNSDKYRVLVLEKINSIFGGSWTTNYKFINGNQAYRTITQDELPAFRAALEACYA